MKQNQVKYQRTRICDGPQSRKISKVKDTSMRLIIESIGTTCTVWNVNDMKWITCQVKNQRSRISNEPKSSEISKDRDIHWKIESIGNVSKVEDVQWTQIKWNIKGQAYPMNQTTQVKYQWTGICSERSNQ